MKPRFGIRLLSTISVALVTWASSDVMGEGVVVFKEQPFHSDVSARAIAYLSEKDKMGPEIILNIGTKELYLDRKKIVAKIGLADSIPWDIIDESALLPLRDKLEKIREFSSRYPNSAPLLAKHLTDLDGYIKHFEGGKVRYHGRWMDRQAYEIIRQKELADRKMEELRIEESRRMAELRIAQARQEKERIIEEARRQEERKIALEKEKAKRIRDERLAFEKSQRDKGLGYYEGSWLPFAEVDARKERDREALMKEEEEERNAAIAAEKYQMILDQAKELESAGKYMEAGSKYRMALEVRHSEQLEKVIRDCESKASGL